MNYLLILWWLGTFLSLIGAFYISNHKRIGFLYWICSNPLIILQCYLTGSWNLVILYIVFWILALYGYLKLVKKVKSTIKVIS